MENITKFNGQHGTIEFEEYEGNICELVIKLEDGPVLRIRPSTYNYGSQELIVTEDRW